MTMLVMLRTNTQSTLSYLGILEHELLREVSVQEAEEDDGQAQDEVEARVHPGLEQGGARHSRVVTEEVRRGEGNRVIGQHDLKLVRKNKNDKTMMNFIAENTQEETIKKKKLT